MSSHALLSASSANRWLQCPASIRLCEKMADSTSVYAEVGSEAHALYEYLLKVKLGTDATDPTADLAHLDAEMQECAEGYVAYVFEKLETAKQTCKDPVVMVEQKLDFSRWVKDGFGTADCVIVADDTLTVIDFKYGQGVEVTAEQNPQMMLYALGSLCLFESLYDISQVNMCIYQPRKANVSEWSMHATNLLHWAEGTLKPVAEVAYAGGGEFKSGEWCRFCKARATCRCRAKANLEVARADFAPPATLEDAEIADILLKLDDIKAWCEDVKSYALAQALKGKKWQGFKLVEGRSARKFTDDALVAKAVSDAGYEPYEQKLKGITSMTRMLGKKQFEEVLGALTVKPAGKPTLVKEDDKRQEISIAKLDFKEI